MCSGKLALLMRTQSCVVVVSIIMLGGLGLLSAGDVLIFFPCIITCYNLNCSLV